MALELYEANVSAGTKKWAGKGTLSNVIIHSVE